MNIITLTDCFIRKEFLSNFLDIKLIRTIDHQLITNWCQKPTSSGQTMSN